MKLSDQQVVEIRRKVRYGWPTRTIADDYGVTPGTIRDIATGRRRGNVPDHTGPTTIDAPGIYDGVPEMIYHSDSLLAEGFGPSLSSTQARQILDSPARYRWTLDHPEKPKAAFDLGHVAHGLVLGVGLDVVAIPTTILASNGAASTSEARAFIAEAREAGKVPIKQVEMDRAKDMAAAVLRHPAARAALSTGRPEQSVYWDEGGVTCRGRIDWLRPNVAVDLKTGRSADPARFGKAAAEYGYEVQSAWYRRGLAALGAADLPFLHILVEAEPPHLVSVIQLDDEALDLGHRLASRALDTYRHCLATDEWPGYGDDITAVSLPTWHHIKNQEI